MSTYTNFTQDELIKILNKSTSMQNIIRLYISTILVYKVSSWFNIKDIDALVSSSLEIYYRSFNNKITKNYIYKLIYTEINLINNIFIKNNYRSESDIEYARSNDNDEDIEDKILVSMFKEKILLLCPNKYKLVIYNLIESGELLYDEYDYYDKIIINNFLMSMGYTMGSKINIPILKKLDTLQKKILFFFNLNQVSKELFIYLISMKSLTNVFLYLESMSSNNNVINIIDAIDIIENCVKYAIDFSTKNNLTKEEKELFCNISYNIMLNDSMSTDYIESLSNGLEYLETIYKKEIDKEVKKNAYNLKNLSIISNLLRKEIDDQINVVNLMNNI